MFPMDSQNASTGSASGSGVFSDEQRISIAVLVGIVVAVTVIGNALVIVAFFTTRSLRSYTNHLILGLAMSDLLVGCVDMPLFGMVFITGHWPFSELVCDVFTFCGHAFSHISITSVAIISLDRFVAIVFPFYHRSRWRRRSHAICLISIGFVIPVVTWAPPTLFWRQLAGDANRTVISDKCIPRYVDSATFGIMSPIVFFLIPFSITTLFYYKIYTVIHRINGQKEKGHTNTPLSRDKEEKINAKPEDSWPDPTISSVSSGTSLHKHTSSAKLCDLNLATRTRDEDEPFCSKTDNPNSFPDRYGYDNPAYAPEEDIPKPVAQIIETDWTLESDARFNTTNTRDGREIYLRKILQRKRSFSASNVRNFDAISSAETSPHRKKAVFLRSASANGLPTNTDSGELMLICQQKSADEQDNNASAKSCVDGRFIQRTESMSHSLDFISRCRAEQRRTSFPTDNDSSEMNGTSSPTFLHQDSPDDTSSGERGACVVANASANSIGPPETSRPARTSGQREDLRRGGGRRRTRRDYTRFGT